MKIVLFDIDGTLLSAGAGPVIAFDRAFSELYGLENAFGGVELHGRTDRWIVRCICSTRLRRQIAEEEFNALCARYIEHYRRSAAELDGFRVLPGAGDLVGRLSRSEHVLLGVQTGNLELSAGIKLRRAGLQGYFSFGGYGSDHEERREIVRIGIERGCALHGISQAEVVVVGDSPYDIEAGKAAGALTVGVATGKSSRAELEAAASDLVLDSLDDVEELIKLLEV